MAFLDSVAKAAAEFIEISELLVPPINIFRILEDLKISVFYADLPAGVDGTGIEGQPEINIRPIIILDTKPDYRRRRFTAAHELKHIIFDKGEKSRNDYDLREKRLEQEANFFASLILMPDIMLTQLLDAYSDANVTLVSRVFGLSSEAAFYRLLNIGAISSDSVYTPQFKKDDKIAFKKLQFEWIPLELKHWRNLKSVMYGSDLMHRSCMRCRIPIIDDQHTCCWGCGRTTWVYTASDLSD